MAEGAETGIGDLPPHLYGARYVFVPDKEKEKDKDKNAVWLLAEIVKYIKFIPEDNSELIVRIFDDSGNANKPYTTRASLALPVKNLNSLHSPPTDLIKLEDASPPGILFALGARYRSDQIYTSIGPILVSFNPFKIIRGLYDLELVERYKKGKLTLSDHPHVFALAAECLRDLGGSDSKSPSNQSLIICGESGSGKTEATKQCLFYLASAITNLSSLPPTKAGKRSSMGADLSLISSGGIETKILQASPLLEAWGNAKTLKNNNSSRFGKYIEVFFDKGQKKIVGSANTTYLLEKSRVVYQEKNERNYHIFYQVLFGEDHVFLQELGLTKVATNPLKCPYIGMGQCVSIMDVDDGADYANTRNAYTSLGFNDEEIKSLTTLLAVILHMGAVSFSLVDEDDEQRGVKINEGERIELGLKSYTSLELAIQLLGIDDMLMRRALMFRRVRSGGSKRKSVTETPFKLTEAQENKNAFAKELYCRCFNYIVEKVNSATLSGQGAGMHGPGQMVGVLDIFGFEIFDKNSLEQLCINFANEALQGHFNTHIFEAEIKRYMYEKIEVPPLAYVDNRDVLDLIQLPKNPPGLLALLDDGGKAVGQGDPIQALLNRYNEVHGKNKRFSYKIRFKSFSVNHYAGEVMYDPTLFLIKNKDRLSVDLIEVLTKSSMPLIKTMFTEVELIDGGTGTNKLSVTRQFHQQLEELIRNLNASDPKYIRCIKPNDFKMPNRLVHSLTYEQLTYTGVFEVVKIMQSGYPFYLKYRIFRDHYHCLVLNSQMRRRIFPRDARAGDEVTKDMIVSMLEIISISENVMGNREPNCLVEAQVGTSCVFYRAPQYMFLEARRTAVRLKACLLLQRWGRGSSVRFLTHKILAGYRLCFRSAVLKDLIGVVKITTEPFYTGLKDEYTLSQLIGHLRKIVVAPKRLFTTPLDVCQKLAETLTELRNVSVSLKEDIEAIGRREKMVHLEYERMERILSGAQAIEYDCTLSYVGKSEVIRVRWDDDSTMLVVEQRVKTFCIITRLKKRLDECIGSINEEECELALVDLRRLRLEGHIDSVQYSQEEADAQSVVDTAAVSLEHFTMLVAKTLSMGSMVTSRPTEAESAALGTLEFTVSSRPLRELVARCSSREQLGLNRKSRRSRKLIETMRRLRDLRIGVEEGAWKELREDIKSQGWLSLLGLESTIKENLKIVEAAECQSVTSSKPKPKAAKPRSDTLSPPTIPRTKKVVKTSTKVPIGMAQLYTQSLEPFYVNLRTGASSWELDRRHIPAVLYMSHIDDQSNAVYFEDLVKGGTMSDPPFHAMSPAALPHAQMFMKLPKSECEKVLGPLNHAKSSASLDALNDYIMRVEDGEEKRVPVTEEIILETEEFDEDPIIFEGEENDYEFPGAIFVPLAVLKVVNAEIKQMSIAALHFSIFPHLEKALKKGPIQERIYFNGSGLEVSVDTTDLQQTIGDIEEYRPAFDAAQERYFRRSQCHLRLRQAAHAGDLPLLQKSISDSHEIATANEDYPNACKICAFYDILETLLSALKEDGAKGVPSLLDFSSIRPERLNEALVASKVMVGVEGKFWGVLLQVCETIQSIRQCMLQKEFEAASSIMTNAARVEGGWYSSNVNAMTGKRRHTQALEKGYELALTLAVNEIEQIKTEMKHLTAMRNLLEAMNRGSVTGNVGQVAISAVNPTVLDIEASKAKPNLILTAEITKFLDEIALISFLRKLVCAHNYGEMERALQPLFESSRGFESCHPSTQREFRTIYCEAADYRAREKLLQALVHGQLHLNPFTLDVDIHHHRKSHRESSVGASSPTGRHHSHSATQESLLVAVQAAINFASLVETKSEVLDQLIEDAELALILREAVLASRWESPTVLICGSMRLDELYPLLTRQGPWKQGMAQLPSPGDIVTSLESLGPQMLLDPSHPLYVQQKQIDTISDLIELFDLNAALEGRAGISEMAGSVLSQSLNTPAPNLLTVSEVLAWSEQYVEKRIEIETPRDGVSYTSSYSVKDELSGIRASLMERRYRLAMVLGASTGSIRGNIDALDFSRVDISLIQRAKAYVDKCTPVTLLQMKGSVVGTMQLSGGLMDTWRHAVDHLIKIRRTALAGLAAQQDVVPLIKSCMKTDDVARVLDQLQSTGFPDGELQIVLSLVNDDICFSALLECLREGGPAISTGGLLSSDRISTEAVMDQIAVAESYPARSQRLDRLVSMAKLCTVLRQGVVERLWGCDEATDNSWEEETNRTHARRLSQMTGSALERAAAVASMSMHGQSSNSVQNSRLVDEVLGNVRQSVILHDLVGTREDETNATIQGDDNSTHGSDESEMSEDWISQLKGQKNITPPVRTTLAEVFTLEQQFKANPLQIASSARPTVVVPPVFLMEEFHLVAREVERQDLLACFPRAFRSGAVQPSAKSHFDCGVSMNTLGVDLKQCNTDTLKGLIQRAERWEAASSVVNRELRLFKQAGIEVTRLRRELRRLQVEYRRVYHFPSRSGASRATFDPTINDKDGAGDTPIHRAISSQASHSSPAVVHDDDHTLLHLLQHGADSSALDRHGRDAMTRARAQNATKCIAVLTSWAADLRRLRLRECEEIVGRFGFGAHSHGVDFQSTSNFTEDTIQQAVSKISSLSAPPYTLFEEWEPVTALLHSSKYAVQVPSALPEIRLLSAVSVGRSYLSRVLRIFSFIAQGDRTIYEDEARAAHLLEELIESNEQLLEQFSQLASAHGKLYRPLGSVKFVMESSIFLLHLMRAERNGWMEVPHRGWDSDAYHFMPTFEDLKANQANGKPQFTVQALLRATLCDKSTRLLHPTVLKHFDRAYQEVEDLISLNELGLAVTTGGPVSALSAMSSPGLNGESHPGLPAGSDNDVLIDPSTADFSVMSTDALSDAINRVIAAENASPRGNTSPVLEAEVRSLFDSCNIIKHLRRAVLGKDFFAGFKIIEKSLGRSKGDAVEIVKHLQEASSVIHPLARAEFGLLTAHICEGYWRSIEESSLEPGMYVKHFTSLMVLSEQSSVVHRLCEESSHIIHAPLQTIKAEDTLPALVDPFIPGQWTSQSGAQCLGPNQRNASAQTDGTTILSGDSVQEEKYHQLVYERESIIHTIDSMREEKERSLRVLRLREEQALARIKAEEMAAYAAIETVVQNDQKGFDNLRRHLEAGWCELEVQRSMLREAEEKAGNAHNARLRELGDLGDRLSRHHVVVCKEKKKVAEKRMQLDLLLRQLNIQVAR